MHMKILLPDRIFAEKKDVKRLVVETNQGSYGILPHRLDVSASLVPGILQYETDGEEPVYVAIDEGVMVKFGTEVLISVRQAFGGADLGQMRKTVEKEFETLSEQETNIRSVLASLESGLVRRFSAFQHE